MVDSLSDYERPLKDIPSLTQHLSYCILHLAIKHTPYARLFTESKEQPGSPVQAL